MWWPILAALALGGCAQIFEIEQTSAAPDAQIDANRPDAPQPCLGGDARGVDPMTGHCYVYFTSPMIRDAARTACRSLGPAAHLASVQGSSEQTLIAGLIGMTTVFIDGTDEALEGRFVFSDGVPLQLTNWAPGEPNNGGGTFEEDCIQMVGAQNGLWNDIPCAPPPAGLGSYPFVCERD